ncbi:hypothetical protein H6F51_24645 [Cyanobacteria bacterium FACHB-DQ100]|nr:hypothetical protein [Cyanobacteria bacterium FACHB-DQ100]
MDKDQEYKISYFCTRIKILLQSVPWISLSLLLTGYIIQGYLLAQVHAPWLIYLSIVMGYILLQLVIFHPWTQQARNIVKQWISSDALRLIEIFVLVFLISLVVSALKLFEEILLILAAEILARLDLQQRELNQTQRGVTLTLCFAAGLAIGSTIHQLMTQSLT